MSTIVGLEIDGGALIVGDRTVERGGTRVGDTVRRVFDFEDAGAAAVGDPGEIPAFERRLDAEIRASRTEREERIGIHRLAHISSPIADALDIDAIVSAYDDESVARIRSVGRDGSILGETPIAFGTGAPIALGRLDEIDRADELAAVEKRVRGLFDAISKRDPKTGTDVDTWTLESATRN